MNNNMPNNFNNGASGNGNNPIANAAKEQLVGGQSSVGNGPSVMQGMPNVQNNLGAMQGVGSIPNSPNVAQGNPMANQKPEGNPVMPGQNHSGINAMTMQKEEVKKETPEVVSIPNFASNIPEKPVPHPNVVQTPNQVPGMNNPVNNQMPNTLNQVRVNNPVNNQMPNILNQVGVNNPVNNQMPNIPNQVGVNNPVNNQMPNIPNQVGVNNPLNSQMPNTPNQIGINSKPLNNQTAGPNVNMPNINEPKTPNMNNNMIGGSISQPQNVLGQVNNQNLNGFPSDSINQMNGPKPQNNIGIGSPISNNLNTMNNMPNSINNEINPAKDLNDSMPSVNNSNFNSGVSQIGANDMDNDMVEMPEEPEKKFPLSVREMILIGIALVGIVAVVIMYWPR